MTASYVVKQPQSMIPRLGRIHIVSQFTGPEGLGSYGRAREVLNYLGRNAVVLNAVTSKSFVLPAPRPRSEMLRNYMLELRGMKLMRDWREALSDYLGTHFSHEKQG